MSTHLEAATAWSPCRMEEVRLRELRGARAGVVHLHADPETRETGGNRSLEPRLAGVTPDAIDPADLEVCLRVLAEAEALPVEHSDAVAVRRATGALYKTVKERRRAERRAAVLALSLIHI